MATDKSPSAPPLLSHIEQRLVDRSHPACSCQGRGLLLRSLPLSSSILSTIGTAIQRRCCASQSRTALMGIAVADMSLGASSTPTRECKRNTIGCQMLYHQLKQLRVLKRARSPRQIVVSDQVLGDWCYQASINHSDLICSNYAVFRSMKVSLATTILTWHGCSPRSTWKRTHGARAFDLMLVSLMLSEAMI